MNHLMAKFDGIKGQELLDVEEQKDEITLIFKDNRFLFIKIENGKLVSDSVYQNRLITMQLHIIRNSLETQYR